MYCRSKATLPAGPLLAAIALCAIPALSAAPSLAQVPPAIAVPSGIAVLSFHAEGAQIYQCESVSGKKLEWQAREPIATLILDGETVGRHYAGMRWEHIDGSKFSWEHRDGSAVQGKVAASAPGATPDDIPWLRLDVTSESGGGAMYGMTAVQRINTKGGTAKGSCDSAGNYLSVPFSADYVFWGSD